MEIHSKIAEDEGDLGRAFLAEVFAVSLSEDRMREDLLPVEPFGLIYADTSKDKVLHLFTNVQMLGNHNLSC